MKNNKGDRKSSNDELSALISGTDEFFKDVSTKSDMTQSFGRNSGLTYQNRYAKAGGKLASNNVVDVSVFKKAVSEESINSKVEEETEKEAEEDEEILDTKPTESNDDDDFDKFFEEFMNDLNNSEESENEPQSVPDIKAVEEKPKKPKAPRKKKRAIDIDIISGGIGGDII